MCFNYCQVCLHIRGFFVFVTEASTVQQNDSDRTQIIKEEEEKIEQLNRE